MKPTTTTQFGIALAGVLAIVLSSAQADTFGTGANQFTIDFVPVGDPGNANDVNNPYPNPGDGGTPYGAGAYTFRMGVYEVSEDMITKANTLGNLLITKDTRGVDKPATSVSWNEAARFVNWLNTSTGHQAAYKFTLQPGDSGYDSNSDIVLWTSGDSGFNSSNPYRNSNAYYFLPSEDEWYKAAYYSGSGTTYYDYPTGSNTAPIAVASGTASGTTVYNTTGLANIDQAGGLSHYGTMGQGGNVYEWQESALAAPNDSPSENRVIRGGDFVENNILAQSAAYRNISFPFPPSYTAGGLGFRVAAVPEPSTWAMLAAGAASLLALRRRKRNSA